MTMFEKSVADWPKTSILKEGGIHVTGKYVQPALPRFALGTWFLLVIAAVLCATIATNNIGSFIVVVPVMLIVYFVVWQPLLFHLFGKNVDVKIFPEKIQVRQGFWYKNYTLDEPIEFRVEQHHKALAEARQEQRKNRKQPRVYREAIEVVMQYGEKRVVIAELRDKELERGKALVIRLQNTVASLDEALRRLVAGQIVPAGSSSGEFGPEPEVR